MFSSIKGSVAQSTGYHDHAVHELMLCLSDEGRLDINGDVYQYKKGRSFLISGGTRHRILCESGEQVFTQFICFDEVACKEIDIYNLERYLEKNNTMFAVSDSSSDLIRQDNISLAEKFVGEQDLSAGDSLVVMRCILTQLLINHCRTSRSPCLLDSAQEYSSIRKCCDDIVRHPEVKVDLVGTAKKVGMSRTKFSEEFKKETGVSFVEFVNNSRIKIASQQLVMSNKDIAEIAFSCGFGNIGYFYKTFNKKLGMTPSEYRRHAKSQAFLKTKVIDVESDDLVLV